MSTYAAETKRYGLSAQVTSTLKMPTKEAVVKTLDECMWDAWEASKNLVDLDAPPKPEPELIPADPYAALRSSQTPGWSSGGK